MFLPKLKAFSTHLLISFIILSLFFSLLIFIWFPEPYFSATGGWQGLKLVAFVDLVLGPILTFIVFSPSKKLTELRRDLSIIAIMQLSVLFFGIYTVYSQRPLAIVFWQNSFKTVSATEIDKRYTNSDILRKIKESPLEFYIVKQPSSLKEKQEILDLIDHHSIAPHQQLNLFRSLKDNTSFLKNHSINIEQLVKYNDTIKNELDSFLDSNNAKSSEFLYIPLVSKYQTILLIFNHNQDYINYLTTNSNYE